MVLVTHGALAVEFKSALEHVVGPQEQVETICIGPMTTWKRGATTSSHAVGTANTRRRRRDPHRHVRRHALNLAISVMKNRRGRGHRRGEPADAGQARPRPRRPRHQGRRDQAAEAGRKYINVASESLGG